MISGEKNIKQNIETEDSNKFFYQNLKRKMIKIKEVSQALIK